MPNKTLYGTSASGALIADYFYRAGLLYLEQSNREKALEIYELLKLTNSKELERKLFKKLYPEE